jgi:succinoglycan biosynthesis protein ExoV
VQLCYCRTRIPNFGDDLNSWLWHALVPQCFTLDSEWILLGIGSIIDRTTIDVYPGARNWVVLGTGVGYNLLPRFAEGSWNSLAVRGPLTAKILNAGPEIAVTDSAALLGALPECSPLPESERHGIVFMPHHSIVDMDGWRLACAEAGIEFLDPSADSRALTQRIRRSRLVLADAMHSAIVADTLRVPWVPLSSSPQISTFKWLDWALSMRVEYAPLIFPPISVTDQSRVDALRWGGKVLRTESLDEDAVMAGFLAKQGAATNPWKRNYERALHFAHRNIEPRRLKRILKNGSRDPKYHDRAVNALREAATSRSFLSNDTIYQDKLGVMMERLDKMQKMVS